MTRYTDGEIMFFRAVAWSLGLSAPPEFFDWPIDTLQKICNGVGGEGSWLTPVLTWVYANYQASAAIHDLDYHIGGSEADREQCDKRLLNNMLLEWADCHGWSRWFKKLAWRERAQIKIAYIFVRKNGDAYWRHK